MAHFDRDVTLTGAQNQAYDELLTPEAINFVAGLARRFQPGLEQLLAKRVKVQAAFDSGSQKLDFNPHTQDIREKEWKVCCRAYSFKGLILVTQEMSNRAPQLLHR